MSRRILLLPPGTTVEVTTRTLRGMYMLPATRQFARTVVGVLARAQEKYPVAIHSAVMLSSHYHLILTPEDRDQLADFMEFFNGNLARETCREIGWSGALWGDRYHPIPITSEPEALVGRLRYHLSHGVKEDLVEQVCRWEGLHCAQALIDGVPLEGIWYNRTLEGEVGRGRKVEADVETHYSLKLAPLPCWKNLSSAKRRELVRRMVDQIDAAVAQRRVAKHQKVLGMEAVHNQNPFDRSENTEDSERPLVHAVTEAAHEAYETVHRGFVKVYREASKNLRQGDRTAVFPRWSFPPGLAFVRDGPVVVNFWDGWILSETVPEVAAIDSS